MINLRREIANALKLAEDPAKLVLHSTCRFSVQGSKTFCRPPVSHQKMKNEGRMVEVLILECFVTTSSDVNEIAKIDQEYAAEAAICWRKRMVKDGGLGQTDEVDARGLLLLISGFGIQDHVFKIQDIMDLIRASNVKGISAALRRSVFLMPKIPEVIDLMVKNNLEAEAADIAYTFGLEDKCHPQSILGTILHNDITNIQDDSSFQMSHENVRTPECLEETDVSNKPEPTDILNKPEEINILKKPEQTDICQNREQIDVLHKPEEIDTSKKHEEIGTSTKVKEPKASKNLVVSKLENLCRGMLSEDIKWHVAEHFSQMINRREEIAKALKLAKDPAKLVLESIGRFFVQGSRTFCNPANPPQHKQKAGRMAAILILECFVMISNDDGIEIAKSDQDCAAKAAVDWRKRMIREGGPGHTDEVDARGLLLLISGFGIQNHVFKIKDIMDLIRASNVKEISTALRRSVFLVPKIPEVIDFMVKKNLEIEAADIAYAFGLEDKCHPQNILASFLHNKIKDIQNGSSFQMVNNTLSLIGVVLSFLVN
ncbi:uncharacterized protein LOC143531174 [Bidens hawaiensis]|uniref:uncharacterized protein LOC143531174 n=1 Tax=Bidens hawaiensis TaxID=980011 RepID=UPI00404A4CAA